MNNMVLLLASASALRAPLRPRPTRTLAMAAKEHFDYLVIGAGSGGIASAKRAAQVHGKKVAVVERGALGGTCVNVGCVPKKVMFNAAHIMECLHDAPLYQYSGAEDVKLDWGKLKTARDNYVVRLNGIYGRGLDGADITTLTGLASFGADGEVMVGGEAYTADHVLVAVGGVPSLPLELEGGEHTITSDGFFELEAMPESCLVVGAGYIAVEMAGILNALGCDTTLAVRGDKALRAFDELLSTTLDAEMKRAGMKIATGTTLAKVELVDGKKVVTTTDGATLGPFDEVLMAVGRKPLVEPLKLENAGVDLNDKGYVSVDEYQRTTSEHNVYALGDVCGAIELTPMAIAAGRRLSDRLFGGPECANAKADYEGVPTVVFSHPTIGTIGLTEAEALEKYGEANIKVWTSTFVNLWYGPMPIDPSDKPKTAMKLITAGSNELVVGLHVIGLGADEMLQGFGVAMKMGATKADFDSCIALHPTAAEEFVTLAPWGQGAGDKMGDRSAAPTPVLH